MGLQSRWVVTCALALSTACAGAELSEPKTAPPSTGSIERRAPHDDGPVVAQPTPSASTTPAEAEPQVNEGRSEPSVASAPPPPARPEADKRGDVLDSALGGRPAMAPKRAEAKMGSGRGAEIGLGSLGVTGHGYGGGGAAMGRAAPPAAYVQAESSVPESSREGYAHVAESDFVHVKDQALSTFSIDVDTASYSNVRRFLREGRLPPADAVRIEELINYFDYDYPTPDGAQPFSTYAEVGDCPWNSKHRLVHVGIKGKEIAAQHIPPRNLVFLIDVSGSMQSADKLPLLTQGLSMLARDLRPEDRISMVVYAGASGVVLEPTSGSHKGKVLKALEQLSAGGSTNGAAGIELAYQVAEQSFMKGGINRVILATDGDFNVGPSSEGELVRIIEEKRKSGVFLTVLGFGTGNLQDSHMEQLADKGNGNYAYIDTLDEAHKVLVREAGETLVTIAKDVKLQVEFNPAHVESYRLIGYENRTLAARDFNDDKKDAGEIGAGHTVTALYEIVPAGVLEPESRPLVDPLRYQRAAGETEAAASGELLTMKIRYKAPDADTSRLLVTQLKDHHRALSDTSPMFRFSAAVAGFGMLLRHSDKKGDASLESLTRLAGSALGKDPHGEKGELLDMMRAAKRLGLGS